MTNKEKIIKDYKEHIDNAKEALKNCEASKREHKEHWNKYIADGYTYEEVFDKFIKDYDKLINTIENDINIFNNFIEDISKGVIIVKD